jgi:hypothetical protein
MLQAIGAFLQLVLLIFSKWAERDKEIREQKAKIHKELEDALLKGNTSAINAGLDAISRMHK